MRHYGETTLDPAIRSRMVKGINGLDMHVLEAGRRDAPNGALLLLHGFPELAYSWRKVMVPLAGAGWHVIAPDQRGYGRTSGWSADYDTDLAPFRMLNLARDAFGLISALGHRSVGTVVGHDFGASVAAWCALTRPDVFRSLVIMSAPFTGPPSIPFGFATETGATGPRTGATSGPDIHAALAALPVPRKHYQWYYSTRPANTDMWRCPQGVHAFLRAYFHHKSADWKANQPFRLDGWTAPALAQMPTYYIMPLHADMAATVAAEHPSPAEVAACRWLPEEELAVYAGEYERVGFQGGLHWYRCRTTGAFDAEHQLYAGRTIDVPATFIAGASDWGIHQVPGAIETMQQRTCTRMVGCHMVESAGHWVQQERSGEVLRLILAHLEVSRD